MKILKLSAFILAAVLLLGLGSTTLSADTNEAKSEKLTLDINTKVCDNQKNCKCEKCECGNENSTATTCTCAKCECGIKNGSKAAMKCGAGKCGSAMQTPKAAMKCGAGKCGTN